MTIITIIIIVIFKSSRIIIRDLKNKIRGHRIAALVTEIIRGFSHVPQQNTLTYVTVISCKVIFPIYHSRNHLIAQRKHKKRLQ